MYSRSFLIIRKADEYMEFKLVDDEYEKANKELFRYIPTMKIKFRDELCFSGEKYSYDSLSQVAIIKEGRQYRVEPLPFINDITSKGEIIAFIDYAPIYMIGVLELLHLALLKDMDDEEDRNFDIITMKLFKSLTPYKSYEEIEEALKLILANNNDVKTLTNLLYTQRTSYQKTGHTILMNFVNGLFFVWLKDKKNFWQIFFEIMELIKPLIPALLGDYIEQQKQNLKDEILQDVQNVLEDKLRKTNHFDVHIATDVIIEKQHPWMVATGWLDKSIDLNFQKIEYIVPSQDDLGKQIKHYITDCRGLSINLSCYLYLNFLKRFGTMPTNETPYFNYKSDTHTDYLRKIVSGCFGDDLQAELLRGVRLDRDLSVIPNNTTTEVEQIFYHTGNRRIARSSYENFILFQEAHNLALDTNENIIILDYDTHVNYTNPHQLISYMGHILTFSLGRITQELDTSKYDALLDDKDKQITELRQNLSTVQRKISDLNQADTIEKSAYNTLEEENQMLKEMLASKADTIKKLVQKNNHLVQEIEGYYGDDMEPDCKETRESIPLEDMVDYLNNFNFFMLGGREGLLSQLEQVGWTTVKQENNLSKINKSSLNFDFYITNAKFISHKLVRKFESEVGCNRDNMIYFNGTNTEALIASCYDFVKAFIE